MRSSGLCEVILPTMVRIVSAITVLAILLTGCSGGSDTDSRLELPVSSLPGTYSGVFPCESCPGIPTTLWVRSDGRFFIEQEYPEVDGQPAMNAYNLGRWNWIVSDQDLQLQGSGPRRTFVRPDRDILVMRTDSDLEHRLTRVSEATRFSAVISMSGLIQKRGKSVSFTECLTGFTAPINRGGDYARLMHQYRSVGGDGPTYVELEGRFSWSDDGSLKSVTVERFVTVKAETPLFLSINSACKQPGR